MRLGMQGSCNDSDYEHHAHLLLMPVLWVGLVSTCCLRVQVLESVSPECESCLLAV